MAIQPTGDTGSNFLEFTVRKVLGDFKVVDPGLAILQMRPSRIPKPPKRVGPTTAQQVYLRPRKTGREPFYNHSLR